MRKWRKWDSNWSLPDNLPLKQIFPWLQAGSPLQKAPQTASSLLQLSHSVLYIYIYIYISRSAKTILCSTPISSLAQTHQKSISHFSPISTTKTHQENQNAPPLRSPAAAIFCCSLSKMSILSKNSWESPLLPLFLFFVLFLLSGSSLTLTFSLNSSLTNPRISPPLSFSVF